MSDDKDFEAAMTTLGTWLVEHQVAIRKLETLVHRIESDLASVEDRLTRIQFPPATQPTEGE